MAPLLKYAGHMSEEISDIETDNEDARRDYRRRLENAARLTQSERDSGAPVWEVLRPAYRTQRVSSLLSYFLTSNLPCDLGQQHIRRVRSTCLPEAKAGRTHHSHSTACQPGKSGSQAPC